MKRICLSIMAATLGLVSPALAAVGPDKTEAPQADNIPPSPEAVAITREEGKGFAIRHFPTGLRLYTYDKDPPGQSVCVGGCASAWPPVRAAEGSKPVGNWTLVARNDGLPQWAYQGKPIYVRYHDQANAPTGDNFEGVWHILGNIPVGGEVAAK